MKKYDITGAEAWKMNNQFYPIRKIKNKSDSYSYVGCGGMMVKGDLFEELGKFDERFFKYFEDPDICFLADREGHKIGWNCEPVIVHNHIGPLLNNTTKKYFIDSLNKFRQKWKDYTAPVLGK